MRILVTTISFQDTPGAHHDVLAASGFDIVHARGSVVTWREATKYLPAAMKCRPRRR